MDNDARDDESLDRITNGLRSMYVDFALDATVTYNATSSDNVIDRSINRSCSSRLTIGIDDKKLMHTNRDPSSSAPTLVR